MEPAISIQGLSKQYSIGQQKSSSLRDSLAGMFSRTPKTEASHFWAIKDVSFDIMPGDVVGIVGKNGAGKSTLLKLLSRITYPTHGRIVINGRVASLLEVGTGFHPELTGRENIYLNGTILGMNRSEVKSKFDEIVEFSGVSKFIDNPVKHYSSGMYVRLAFAVAAHLEPEILVVDEVLAVGDAEFQKKCIGKMQDVSKNGGRTVLFVSHNMSAVNSLCTKGVLLQAGQVTKQGTAYEITDHYLKNAVGLNSQRTWDKGGDEVVRPVMLRVIDEMGNPTDFMKVNHRIGMELTYDVLQAGFKPKPNFHVLTANGDMAFVSVEPTILSNTVTPGRYKSTMWIPSDFLNEGPYTIGVAISTLNPVIVHFEDYDALNIDVIDDLDAPTRNEYTGKFKGAVRPLLPWVTQKIS
jgi:lipopolysaccharide transport system ATP-binding protein